jgi:large subunit ribosomal protein L31
MKKDKHPTYQYVLFADGENQFLIRSTYQAKSTAIFKEDGKEYSVCSVSVSSATHPFYIGKSGFQDTEGRINKFLKRYASKAEEIKKNLEKQEEANKEKAKQNKKKK